MTWQRAAAIAAVLAVLGSGTVAFFKYHATFASADEVQQVTTDFKYYVLSNQAAALQSRMWQLEDRHGCEPNRMPQSSKEEYRKLLEQKKMIEIQIQSLENSKRGKQ